MRQSQAIEILLSGRSAFLTGAPGAGKSHVIGQFMKRARALGWSVALTASTGVAAMQIGGQTIHGWSGIGARRTLSEIDISIIKKGKAGARIGRTEVLIVDEVSMLSGDFIQNLDYACRAARSLYDPGAWRKPFGGLQVIFVGDFFQLPPVVSNGDPRPKFLFAFEAQAWNELDPAICYITENHRQKDDPEFTELLASIRAGRCDPGDYRLWARKVEDAPAGVPFLSTHRDSVDAVNAARLKDLLGRAKTFIATSEGDPRHVSTLQRNCPSPGTLTLKEGALVMFTRNDADGRYVNGSAGVVLDVSGADGFPVVRLRAGAVISAAPVTWEVAEELDEEEIDTTVSAPQKRAARQFAERRILARISQVPLRLAWCLTVHKSQGMSLDAAVIDLSRTFEYGQGYVALSRVRSLDGLYLRGWHQSSFLVHPAVLRKDFEFRAASEVLEAPYVRDELRRPASDTFNASEEPICASRARRCNVIT